MTIFFAVKLTRAELPDWLDFILVAYVAFHVVMHFIFSVSFGDLVNVFFVIIIGFLNYYYLISYRASKFYFMVDNLCLCVCKYCITCPTQGYFAVCLMYIDTKPRLGSMIICLYVFTR